MMTRAGEEKAIAELRERMLGIGVASGAVVGILVARHVPGVTTARLVLGFGSLGLWHIAMLACRLWRSTR